MQAFERFGPMLVADREGGMVHGNHAMGLEIKKGLHRLLRIHVNFATTRAVIGTDRKKGGMNVVAFPDLRKSIKIGGVPRMIDGVFREFDDKAAETLVGVVNVASPPVMGRGKVNLGITKPEAVPVRHLLDAIQIQLAKDLGNPPRHDHRLGTIHDALQRHPAEVIKVGVSNKNQINFRQVLDVDAGVPVALQRSDPLRPDRIDEDVEILRSHQKARMPDPDDFDLVRSEREKLRSCLAAGRLSFPDKGGEEAAAQVAVITHRPAPLRH